MLVRVEIDGRGAVCNVTSPVGATWDARELEEKLSLLKLVQADMCIEHIGRRYTNRIFYLRMEGEINDEVRMRRQF